MAAQAQTAGAPNPPGTNLPGVTVVAPKSRPPNPDPHPTPEIRNFVRSHAVTTRIGQLARWREGICPRIVGLPADFGLFVSRRIHAVAAMVDAPISDNPRCSPNIAVLFTAEPQKLMDGIRENKPVLLGYHYPAQLKRMAIFNHPIQAWYATGTQGTGGTYGVNQSYGGFALDDGDFPMPSGAAGSSFSVGLRSEFVSVVVIADVDKASDFPIGAIADYIAVLALSHTNSIDTCGEIPSITDLFAAGCGDASKPNALTAGDIAYLKALYTANLSNRLWVEQDSIADLMQRSIPAK